MADATQENVQNDIVSEVKDAVASAPPPVAAAIDAAKSVPRYWLRDDYGRPSITATIVMIAFFVTTGAFVLSTIPPLTIAGHLIAFKAFDVAACGAYLAPVLALYAGRKWTTARFSNGQQNSEPA